MRACVCMYEPAYVPLYVFYLYYYNFTYVSCYLQINITFLCLLLTLMFKAVLFYATMKFCDCIYFVVAIDII